MADEKDKLDEAKVNTIDALKSVLDSKAIQDFNKALKENTKFILDSVNQLSEEVKKSNSQESHMVYSNLMKSLDLSLKKVTKDSARLIKLESKKRITQTMQDVQNIEKEQLNASIESTIKKFKDVSDAISKGNFGVIRDFSEETTQKELDKLRKSGIINSAKKFTNSVSQALHNTKLIMKEAAINIGKGVKTVAYDAPRFAASYVDMKMSETLDTVTDHVKHSSSYMFNEVFRNAKGKPAYNEKKQYLSDLQKDKKFLRYADSKVKQDTLQEKYFGIKNSNADINKQVFANAILTKNFRKLNYKFDRISNNLTAKGLSQDPKFLEKLEQKQHKYTEMLMKNLEAVAEYSSKENHDKLIDISEGYKTTLQSQGDSMSRSTSASTDNSSEIAQENIIEQDKVEKLQDINKKSKEYLLEVQSKYYVSDEVQKSGEEMQKEIQKEIQKDMPKRSIGDRLKKLVGFFKKNNNTSVVPGASASASASAVERGGPSSGL